MTRLRFLVYGAGAVGGFVGAHLAQAGHTVVLLGRPSLVEAVTRQGGLRLRAAKGEEHFVAGVRTVAAPQEALAIGPYDYLLFTMKAYGTAAAIQELAEATPAPPPIVCLQNGVGNEAAIAAAFGPEKVVAATLTTPVSTLEPGIVVEERQRGLAIATDSPAAGEVIAAFRETALRVWEIGDPDSLKWSKLLLNLITQASTAILDMSPAEIVADPRLFAVEVEALREAIGIMRLAGIRPVNLPGTPAQLLVALVTRLPTSVLRLILGPMIAGGRGDKIPSCHEDLLRGRGQTEIPWLNGAVVQAADRRKCLAPINHMLALTLSDIAVGNIPWEVYRRQPEMLLAAFNVARGQARR